MVMQSISHATVKWQKIFNIHGEKIAFQKKLGKTNRKFNYRAYINKTTYLLLLYRLNVPTTTCAHSLPLPLKVVWHNEVWGHTWAHSRQKLLLKPETSRLRGYNTRSSLTKIQLLRTEPRSSGMESRNSRWQRCHSTRCLNLSKVCLWNKKELESKYDWE